MPDPPKLPDNRKATRYAELLHTATGGHALFQPSNNVFVGDCGYIDRGKFIKVSAIFGFYVFSTDAFLASYSTSFELSVTK